MQPLRHAAVMRASSAVVHAEAVAAIAALGRRTPPLVTGQILEPRHKRKLLPEW